MGQGASAEACSTSCTGMKLIWMAARRRQMLRLTLDGTLAETVDAKAKDLAVPSGLRS
jgi:hypothetical protein